ASDSMLTTRADHYRACRDCCLAVVRVGPGCPHSSFCFFLMATAPTEIYTLSLHDALPISLVSGSSRIGALRGCRGRRTGTREARSEEHTSELQSQSNLVCRLLLEKKNQNVSPRASPAIHPSPAAHPCVCLYWHAGPRRRSA